MNYVFLFGAGAENVFNLPNGDEYVKMTIFYNKDSNDKELKELFNRLTNYYNNDYYEKYFINSNNAIDLANQKKLLYFYLKSGKYKEDNLSDEQYKSLVALLDETDIKELGFSKDSLLKEVKNILYYSKMKKRLNEYHLICLDDDNNKEYYKYQVDKNICTNINFYELEKLYHTIINPKKYGSRKFSSLINYYWCCFHVMYSRCVEKLLGYTDMTKLYGEYSKGIDFEIIKNNLDKMLKVVKNDKDNDIFKYSYYSAVNELDQEATVITTNYSPYAFICKNPVFIHGNLWTFETAELPELIDYEKLNNDYQNLFPYLLCQSSLKPIIHPLQVKNFSNMINALENTNLLFVNGYGLNDDDSHINSIIKDYLMRDNNNILVYIAYNLSDKEIDDKRKYLNDLFKVNNKQIIIENIEKLDGKENKDTTQTNYEQFLNIISKYSTNKTFEESKVLQMV